MDKVEQERRPLRVCYFGTYRAGYTRNQILIAGLRSQQDVVLYECHSQLWQGIEDRVQQASGGWRSPRFWARAARAYWGLLKQHQQTPAYDVMLIGYPGQFDSYLARLLTWWRRRPVALDILMSLYLVAEERGLTAKSPGTARLLRALEKGGLKLPDLLISENESYEAYYCQRYNLSPAKFRRIAHGADDRVFHPRTVSPPDSGLRVTYHGTFLPSHGLDTIISAAEQLQSEKEVQFQFFGDGPERERIQTMAQERGLDHLEFYGYVDRDELLDNLASSHIVLGVFGVTKQSHFTVQNKVWEGIAMGRPVISGDSAVVRAALTPGLHICLVPRSDPHALADAILRLRDDPAERERMARAGYEHFKLNNSIEALGASTVKALRSLVD